MINPFSDMQVRECLISYGVSLYVFDLLVAEEFKIIIIVNSNMVDL